MKTTLDLPAAALRQAKAVAADRGVTLKQFVTEALDEKLRSGGRWTFSSPLMDRQKRSALLLKPWEELKAAPSMLWSRAPDLGTCLSDHCWSNHLEMAARPLRHRIQRGTGC